ncbi:MAG: ribokinase, partial [Candidatus Acidiferrales bacterium]
MVVVGSINLDLVATGERVPLPGETLSGRDFATFHGGKGAN